MLKPLQSVWFGRVWDMTMPCHAMPCRAVLCYSVRYARVSSQQQSAYPLIVWQILWNVSHVYIYFDCYICMAIQSTNVYLADLVNFSNGLFINLCNICNVQIIFLIDIQGNGCTQICSFHYRLNTHTHTQINEIHDCAAANSSQSNLMQYSNGAYINRWSKIIVSFTHKFTHRHSMALYATSV